MSITQFSLEHKTVYVEFIRSLKAMMRYWLSCIRLRLFVYCKNPSCRSKFYISSHAKIREQLLSNFYLTCPICHQILVYYPKDVFAESSEISTAGGALLGGLVGLLLGGIGAIFGTLVGGILGGTREKRDAEAVAEFNNS